MSGNFSEDFSNGLVGTYAYKVRLVLPDGAGLDSLTLRTVTMCAQNFLPHLGDGTNNVNYSATREGIAYRAPDCSTSAKWTASYDSITNVAYVGGNSAHVATVSNASQDALLVVKLDSPDGQNITKVAAAVGMQLPQPPSATSSMKFEYSRNGSTWTEFYSRPITTDANHWQHHFDDEVSVPGTGSTV
ncbi:hypothetical protein ACFL4W_05475, partial [Planctomycetota bacterium]